MMWTGVAGQQLKRLKTERRYLALERAECRFFFYVPKMRTRAKMQIAASDRAGRRWRPGTGFKPGKERFFRKKWHEKTLYILYRDSSFRISISKRFRIKDLKYLVHFLWLKYSTSPRKMIVYSLNELLRFL